MSFRSMLSHIVPHSVHHKLPHYWWFFVCIIGLSAWAIAEMLEVFGKWPACRLCHIERLIFLTLSGLATLRIIAKKWVNVFGPFLKNILSWSVIGTSLVGCLTALYHSAIQFHWIALPSFCALPKTETFEQFMALPTATCDQWTLSFLFLPMPVYLVALFLCISLVSWRCSKIT